MPDPVPRPPKAPPKEPIIRVPLGEIRVPPDCFPPKPVEPPDIHMPPVEIPRPPMKPPLPIIDRAA